MLPVRTVTVEGKDSHGPDMLPVRTVTVEGKDFQTLPPVAAQLLVCRPTGINP
jgi:hypothetical protein